MRHRLVVSQVIAEQPGLTTVVVTGRRLEALPVRGGQFFQWRFLGVPAGPGPTVLIVGGPGRPVTAVHRRARRRRLRCGGRPAPRDAGPVEGPYGRLHAGVRQRRKVLLMASGIGVTPLKAILEDLDQRPGDVVLVHRVHDAATRMLATAVDASAAARGAQVVVVPGRRVQGGRPGCPRAPRTSTMSPHCGTLSPMSPRRMSSSAVHRDGWTPSSGPHGTPACPPRISTSKPSPSGARKTEVHHHASHRHLAAEHRQRSGAPLLVPHLDVELRCPSAPRLRRNRAPAGRPPARLRFGVR